MSRVTLPYSGTEGQTNSTVAATTMTDAAGSVNLAYDRMGREMTQQRTTNSVTKSTTYGYDFGGDVTSLTYPSGSTITYIYDSAARPISAADSVNGINYVSNGAYAPQGALAQTQNGTNLTSTFIYNNRLQPCWIYATTGTVLAASTACTATEVVPPLVET